MKYRLWVVNAIYSSGFVNIKYRHGAVNSIYSLHFVLPQGSGTEAKLIYPIKTLSQLPLVLKGFRKEKGLTQAAMAERLGITQQSYAYFEANPATATLERLFMVLRMLDVEISLDQAGRRAATTGKKDSW